MTTTADRKSGKTAIPESTSQSYKSKYRVVGTRPIRHDGLDKVTGRAKYGADVLLPGLLHGKVLRSPHAHARILRIDVSAALKLPGVKAVVTSADLPITISQTRIDLGEEQGNPRLTAENMLASKKALYKGHAIAAVAAASPHIAEEAVKLIKVDYEVLPPLLDARSAMREGALLIHDNLTTRSIAARGARGTDTGVKSNIASHIQFKRGDLEAGFREADVIVEREYQTSQVHQGYIEPQASTASWSQDGRVTVWTSTQGHFGVRSVTASVLGIPEHSVKVIPMEIGGGFGGKIPSYLDPVCALLSRKTGQPVKIVMSRKEVFEATGPGAGTYMRCKLGAKRDGRLTAAEIFLAYEAGAFPGSPVGAAANTALTPYRVENFLVDGYDVVVNKPKVAAYRAPGTPQGAFAMETAIDEMAEKLGIDPLDFRQKNAIKEGDRMPNGLPLPQPGYAQLLEAMKSHPHYRAPLRDPSGKDRGPLFTSPRGGEGGGEALVGRGVAVGFWGNAGLHSSATLNVNANGSVSVITGSVDIGGTRPAVAMQAAEVLGLNAEDMVPLVADTDSVGFTQVTGGSRTAFSTGLAAIMAAENVKKQMTARAALLWEVKPEDVEFTSSAGLGRVGVFINKKKPAEQFTFKQLAGRLLQTGGPVTASASTNPRQVGVSFCGNIVDVEVDPETGKTAILRFTSFQDVGQAAHPSYVEGQMQGGSVQGIGWALNEEYFFSPDGVMMNSSFLDYRMPTALDLPMIDTVLVEVPNPGHPFGLRGVGEVSIVPPMAAIANAIHQATSCRLTRLPMTPGAILEARAGLG